jgi:hypothetical protein
MANGTLRDQWLHPVLGYSLAMPLSGIILAALIFLVAWLSLPWLGRQTAKRFLYTGALWVGLTLVFEVIFGHYIRGLSWDALLRVFDLADGNLFTLVLLSTLVSPASTAYLREFITGHRAPD